MRLNAARIAPLAEAEMAPELLALLGPRFKAIPVLNIFRTLAHAPKAFKRFMAWAVISCQMPTVSAHETGSW